MKKFFLLLILGVSMMLLCEDIKKAPSFRLENAEGKFIELDSLLLKGPVLLNFWASWCKPCKEELPEFYKIKNEFSAKGLNVILVTIDTPSAFSKAKSFLKTKNYDMELLKDCDMKVLIGMGGTKGNVPYTTLIDKDKNIIFKKKGQTSYGELLKEVNKL